MFHLLLDNSLRSPPTPKGRIHLQALENQSLAGGISPLRVGGERGKSVNYFSSFMKYAKI